MRPPHVRRHWNKFDWEAIETHVGALMPVAQAAVDTFVKADPRWGGEVQLGQHPPAILITLYMKSSAYPGRLLAEDEGEDIGPRRILSIPADELDQVSMVIDAILATTTKMKAHLHKINGYLEYTLKVLDPKLFPKTKPAPVSVRHLSQREDIVLLEPAGTSAETAAEIRTAMKR